MVGVRGFEPPTPSSRTRCATRLRYTPTFDAGAGAPSSGEPGYSDAGQGGQGGSGLQTPVFAKFSMRDNSSSEDRHRGVAAQDAPNYVPRAGDDARHSSAGSGPVRLLGRRQAVRQWILIPPCGGSNPPAPASLPVTRLIHVRIAGRLGIWGETRLLGRGQLATGVQNNQHCSLKK